MQVHARAFVICFLLLMVDKRGYFEFEWVSKYRTAWVNWAPLLPIFANGISIKIEGEGGGYAVLAKNRIWLRKSGGVVKNCLPIPYIRVIFTGQSLFTFQVFIDNWLIKIKLLESPRLEI